jgi:hypothetical protein
MTVDRETTEKLAAPGSPHGGHEADFVAARPVWIAVTVLIALLTIGYFVPTALENLLLEREARRSPPANPLAATEGRRLPPAPRLQVDPARDITEMRLAEDRILNGYGWVDAAKGIARIPITRAIAIAAEKGLPAPAPQAPAPQAPAAGQAPSAQAPAAGQAPSAQAPTAGQAPSARAPAPQAPAAQVPAAQVPAAQVPAAPAPHAPPAEAAP